MDRWSNLSPVKCAERVWKNDLGKCAERVWKNDLGESIGWCCSIGIGISR